MQEILFDFATEKILVRVDGHDVKFGSTNYGAALADISGLKLDYDGVIREHPDLEGDDNWKEEAILRFKDKVKSYENEDDIAKYIMDELRNHGYIPRYLQRKGFRREVIR